MGMLLRYPYSGGYWTEYEIDRYRFLKDEPMSREEAYCELIDNGMPAVSDEMSLLDALVSSLDNLAMQSERIACSLEAITRLTPTLMPPVGVAKVAELAGVSSVKTVYRWKEEGQGDCATMGNLGRSWA